MANVPQRESMVSYSKSVVEGANDLLPAGSKIKFNIDKKNMRITREFEPRGVFVYVESWIIC